MWDGCRSARRRGRLLVLAVLAMAPPAFAQAPKPGDLYRDDLRLGFQVELPRSWDFVPGPTEEENLVARLQPRSLREISAGGAELALEGYLLTFDRSEERRVEAERRRFEEQLGPSVTYLHLDPYCATLTDWIETNLGGDFHWQVAASRPLEISAIEGSRELVFTGIASGAEDAGVRAYAAVFPLDEDHEVALVFTGPGLPRKWSAYERAYARLARSFERVELLAPAIDGGASRPGWERRLLELEAETRRSPEWELRRSPSYFLVSQSSDMAFLRELETRLEALRALFEVDFAPESAADSDSPADVADRMRGWVVRVCANREAYLGFAPSAWSAGHWDPETEELVVYDDRERDGRSDTWAALQHEAFHQYMHYAYPELETHTWWSEGLGDYYGGMQFRHGRFRVKPFAWRVEDLQSALRAGRTVPLKELLRFRRQDYYSRSKRFGTERETHYALGWSFVYFLRHGDGQRPRDWDPAWDRLLERYLEIVVETQDPRRALELTFEGVDWARLENSWRGYVS